MSGGSLGYVDHDMRNDDLLNNEQALRSLPKQLTQALADSVEDFDNEAWDELPAPDRYTQTDVPSQRPVTDAERAAVALHGAAAVQAMHDLLAVVDDLHRRARDLAPLAHALDYAGSGDMSTAGVWQAVLAWGAQRDARNA